MALFEQRDKLCEAADTGASTKPSIAAIDKELVALGYPKDQICDLEEAAHRARLARAQELIDSFLAPRAG